MIIRSHMPLSTSGPLITAPDDDVRTDSAMPELVLKAIRISDMEIDWVENLPSQISETLSVDRKATIRLDDVNVELLNVSWPFGSDNRSQQIQFGQVGAGTILVGAQGNILSWVKPSPDEFNYGVSPALWSPELSGRVSLNNVGADSVSHLIPDARVVATSGMMSGDINFRFIDRTILSIATNLDMRRVAYNIVQTGSVKSVLALDERQHEANGFVVSQFEGNLANPDFKPMGLIFATAAEESVREAKLEMRKQAALQTISLQNGVTERTVKQFEDRRPVTPQRVINKTIQNKITQRLSREGAELLGQYVTGSDETGTPEKGKSTFVGNAFRSIFGPRKKKNSSF